MAKYRKLPVEIEATQWFQYGDHPAVRRYLDAVPKPFRPLDTCGGCNNPHEDHGWINTLEAGHRVCPCDWIITGVQGEMYPCKPDIFAKTYEEAVQ